MRLSWKAWVKVFYNDVNGLLEEEIEESVGAYLPVNNDYDDLLVIL